jgi:hypothetical protein
MASDVSLTSLPSDLTVSPKLSQEQALVLHQWTSLSTVKDIKDDNGENLEEGARIFEIQDSEPTTGSDSGSPGRVSEKGVYYLDANL